VFDTATHEVIPQTESLRSVTRGRDRARWSHRCSRTFTCTISSISGPSAGDGTRPRATWLSYVSPTILSLVLNTRWTPGASGTRCVSG